MKDEIERIVQKHMQAVGENWDYYKCRSEAESVASLITEELGDLLEELLGIPPNE
jgi:hypothetical protein